MLNIPQTLEAIEQMKIHCELKTPSYEMVSARGALYELGYDEEAAEDVLDYIYNSGFTYCLDSKYKSPMHKESSAPEYPSADVCYWGPDQLKSRLESLR